MLDVNETVYMGDSMLNNFKKKIYKKIPLIITIFLIIIYCLLFWLYITSYKNIHIAIIILLFIFAVIGTILLCFPFKVGLILNIIDTMLYRTGSLDDAENEPSNFAIWGYRIAGLIFIILYFTPLIS